MYRIYPDLTMYVLHWTKCRLFEAAWARPRNLRNLWEIVGKLVSPLTFYMVSCKSQINMHDIAWSWYCKSTFIKRKIWSNAISILHNAEDKFLIIWSFSDQTVNFHTPLQLCQSKLHAVQQVEAPGPQMTLQREWSANVDPSIAIAENLKSQAIWWSNFDCFPAAISNIESNSSFVATRAFAKTQRLKCITCRRDHKQTYPSDLQELEWRQRYAQCIKVQTLFLALRCDEA